MEVADSFVVSAKPGEAWEFFWDLTKVARRLPGCEAIARVDESTYKLQMVQRVGPFKVSMDVRMTVNEIDEGRRVVLSGEGKDRMGNRLQISRLAMEIAEAPTGGTQVAYLMDFHLYGRIAALGNTAVKRKVEETRAEFSRGIAEELGG